jgi:hypothetical protein
VCGRDQDDVEARAAEGADVEPVFVDADGYGLQVPPTEVLSRAERARVLEPDAARLPGGEGADREQREVLVGGLGQTLADFELIISDNASTDRTAEICRAYAARDARVRYIRQESNIGVVRNWNFVALQARGQYFKWASANDFCDPRLLEKCSTLMRSDPSVVLCHGGTCLVDEETGECKPYAGDIGATDPRPSERFQAAARTIVITNELSGLVRLDVLRRTPRIPPDEGGGLVLRFELSLPGGFVLMPVIM